MKLVLWTENYSDSVIRKWLNAQVSSQLSANSKQGVATENIQANMFLVTY